MLWWRMLRYRVASMVAMFMLLGAAYGPGLTRPWALALAAFALASAYVAATAVNDVADEPIDRVNHPRDAGRPLVSGDASVDDLWRLHVVASVLALAAAVPLGLLAVGLVALSLGIGLMYSVPPARPQPPDVGRARRALRGLRARPVRVGRDRGRRAAAVEHDAPFAAALVLLFLARIVLKDFRDRAGDARWGRPTLLLRFGKDVTCATSAAALGAGGIVLLAALRPPLGVGAVLLALLAAVAWALGGLHAAAPGREEQVAIGIGARMGNGVLLAVLAWLVVEAGGASAAEQTAVVALVAAAFAVGFVTLVARPEQAVIGYKG